MRLAISFLIMSCPLQSACAEGNDSQAQPSSSESTATDVEIFTAAGFRFTDGAWRKCEDPGTPSYSPGEIYQRGDFNGDGQPDAFVIEGGSYCFRFTGTGYTLVSKQSDGSWRTLDERIGIPELLEEKGADGWPDIEVGGPGFCFPVIRWDGTEYVLNRGEYEGAPCQLQ